MPQQRFVAWISRAGLVAALHNDTVQGFQGEAHQHGIRFNACARHFAHAQGHLQNIDCHRLVAAYLGGNSPQAPMSEPVQIISPCLKTAHATTMPFLAYLIDRVKGMTLVKPRMSVTSAAW